MEHENSQISQHGPSFTNPISSQASLLGMDRISTLPDSIVHHIYNFIPTSDTARTSTLSKRFDKLWKSYPVLDINDVEHYQYFTGAPVTDELYLSFNKPKELLSKRVKRFNLRNDTPRLEKLKISVTRDNINTGYDEDLASEIDDLIFVAAEWGTLKEMDLHFGVSEWPRFPNVLYPNPFKQSGNFYLLPTSPICSWCKSLQHLKLVGCMFGARLQMTEGIIFPSLKTLYISICIVSEDSISDLINGCPELEELCFKYCSIMVDGALRFSSPKLKHLVLGCCLTSMVVDIFVPRLERFTCAGKSVNEDVRVRFRAHHVICAPNLQILRFKSLELDAKGIREALCAYRNLKELQVNRCHFEDKPKFVGKKLERLEIVNCFFLTKSLKLSASSLPVLKSLFIYSCKNLQNLDIGCPELAVRVEGCLNLADFLI